MSKKIGFIITGRMKSTRLEKKLTLKINNREMIAHMIDRAKVYFPAENIVIATSTNPQDDELEVIAKRENINIYRGSEDDVILRLYEAAKKFGFDFFINITADCPLFAYDEIDAMVDIYNKTDCDLITALDLPHGFFTYGMKTEGIKKVLELKKTDNTEVWGDYYYSNPDIFKVEKLEVNKNKIRNDYRLTVDYQEDFDVFKSIFEHFGEDTYKKTSAEILEYLDNNQDVALSNNHCKNLFQQRWESQIATKIEKE